MNKIFLMASTVFQIMMLMTIMNKIMIMASKVFQIMMIMIMANAVFQEHGEKVMEKIDSVVTAIDELDQAVELLYLVGAFHKQFNGFKPEYFRVIDNRQ